MWDHPKKLKNRDKCPRPKKVPLGQSGQHFRLFPKNLQTLEFCLLLEVYSKLFWSKIINQELISLWGPIIDASRILLNEWKNERGLNHYWMKVVNYGWQYSKEHPHVQKASNEAAVRCCQWSNTKVGLVLSIFHSCEKTVWLLTFYKTKITILQTVFASFENQTFSLLWLLGSKSWLFLLHFEPHYSLFVMCKNENNSLSKNSDFQFYFWLYLCWFLKTVMIVQLNFGQVHLHYYSKPLEKSFVLRKVNVALQLHLACILTFYFSKSEFYIVKINYLPLCLLLENCLLGSILFLPPILASSNFCYFC